MGQYVQSQLHLVSETGSDCRAYELIKVDYPVNTGTHVSPPLSTRIMSVYNHAWPFTWMMDIQLMFEYAMFAWQAPPQFI